MPSLVQTWGRGFKPIGEYAGGEEVQTPDIDDLIGVMTDASMEQEHVAGSRLRESFDSMQINVDNFHARRRTLNKERRA